MFYFELVRRYGNIALMTNTEMSKQDPRTFVQVKPEKVYEFIEDDLLYASRILPYAQDDQYRIDNSYRFSRGAALGLLSKVYATGQDILYMMSQNGKKPLKPARNFNRIRQTCSSI
jgi:hypothetical protein